MSKKIEVDKDFLYKMASTLDDLTKRLSSLEKKESSVTLTPGPIQPQRADISVELLHLDIVTNQDKQKAFEELNKVVTERIIPLIEQYGIKDGRILFRLK